MDTQQPNTPDITPMQKIIAALTTVITTVLTTLTAVGVGGLTAEQDTKILGLWAALAGFAVTADAIIRQGRAKHFAIVKAAEINAAAAQSQPAPAARTTATRRKPAARVTTPRADG